MKTRSFKNRNVLLLLSHLAGWGLFVLVTVPSFNRSDETPVNTSFTWYMLASLLFLILYFYLNVTILVPRFLSMKKIFFFLGITVAAFLLFCFVMPQIHHDYLMPRQHFPPELRSSPHFPPLSGKEFPRPPFGFFDALGRHGLYSRSSQFLVVFIASTGLKALSQWYAEKRRLQELENAMVQAELSFLKSQIHPHFLFNSLNNIYYLALSKDDNAPEAILSLSNFLRFVTTESNHNRIPMQKEVKMMEEYSHLQGLRASEKLDLRFQLVGDFSRWSIMPLTFIPFVENAFKYGISAHNDCFIHIRVEVEGGILHFTCDNSTLQRTRDGSVSEGVGLENIRKRLALAYPGRHVLTIQPGDRVYRVKLEINLA